MHGPCKARYVGANPGPSPLSYSRSYWHVWVFLYLIILKRLAIMFSMNKLDTKKRAQILNMLC